jgi:hypothetical protein
MLSILVSHVHDGADLRMRMRSYTSTLEISADMILPADAPKIVQAEAFQNTKPYQ